MGITRCAVIAFALTACGDDPIILPDAPPVIAPRCDPAAAFGVPTRVASLDSDKDDTAARLSPDELTVAFSRRTGAGTGLYDLYTATRESADGDFGSPSLLATVNSVNSDTWPTMSPDGLLLALQTDRTATAGTYHIYTSTRAATTDAFGPPVRAPALMDGEDHPFIANAHALYFTSARTGTVGKNDLWRAEIDSTGATSAPTNLAGVNTVDAEVVPVVTPDELTIFFRRTTADGELDIYTSTRASASDPFGEAVKVPTLAQPALNEVPTWISPDNCVLYVQIDGTTDGPGGTDLFVARRGGP